VAGDKFPEQYAYVALGHIHKPQYLGGHEHVRYSGSIERMDLGEQNDAKGVVLFEIGPEGRTGDIVTLPMPSTPVYEVSVLAPSTRGRAPPRADRPAAAPRVVPRRAERPGEHSHPLHGGP